MDFSKALEHLKKGEKVERATWPDKTGWHTVHPHKQLEDFVDKVNAKESAMNPNRDSYWELDEVQKKKLLDALWEEFKKPNTIEPPKNEAEEIWKKYINDKEDGRK